MAEIALRGVTAGVIRGLDLTIASGELLVCTGPSGAGKTRLLRLIAGLEAPAAGTVMIDGHQVTHLTARERDVAMVTEPAFTYRHLSVRENLLAGLRFRHMPEPEAERRVQAEARALGIAGLLERRIRTLGAGDRQRVALASALARTPRVLLLDEPLAQVDEADRTRLRREIAQLQAGLGITTVYVTQHRDEAMTLGQRVAVLVDGRLEQVGPPGDLWARPASTRVATEFAGLHLLTATLRYEGTVAWLLVGDQRVRLDDSTRRAWSDLAGRRLFVGLRPDAAVLAPGAAGQAALRAAVAERTWRGATVRFQLRVGGETLPVDVPTPEAPALGAGAEVSVRMQTRTLHAFDAVTGVALHHPP